VSNENGADYLTKEDYITVNQAGTSITFFNSTYTDITMEINGMEKIIPPDGDVTYYNLLGSTVDYAAWTSGKTAEGTQVGYLLSWENTIELTSLQIYRTLVISSDYYCLFIRNNGTESLNPLEVGILDIFSDFTVDRTEDITIPNDNEEYRIGYYMSSEAFELTWIQIRAHASDWYVYWTQGDQFSLPDTTNQSIHLYNDIKKRAAESRWKDHGDPKHFLYPDHAIWIQEPN
jgi:PKD repeat protein